MEITEIEQEINQYRCQTDPIIINMKETCRVFNTNIPKIYKIKMNIENLKNHIADDDNNLCRHNY